MPEQNTTPPSAPAGDHIYDILDKLYAECLQPIAEAFGFDGPELDDSFVEYMLERAAELRVARGLTITDAVADEIARGTVRGFAEAIASKTDSLVVNESSMAQKIANAIKAARGHRVVESRTPSGVVTSSALSASPSPEEVPNGE